jgi:superfamily I DNA and RNA helicase
LLSVGDCDIVSTKDDKLFDDDIVIVVSDAYREKKREERRNKANTLAASSSSEANIPSTSSGEVDISDKLSDFDSFSVSMSENIILRFLEGPSNCSRHLQ